MNLRESIHSKTPYFLELCKAHQVHSIYAFGSATNDKFDEEHSDIDLLININNPDPIEKGENLMRMWDQLELFFERKVDLVTYDSIRNPILRENIDATKVLIYDGKEQKISI